MAITRMTEVEKAKTSGIIELYTCVQSEGSRAGRPTVAVRTTGCTHRCYFGEGGWCDSFYTSIHPEKARYSFNDVVAIYDANPEIKEMMLTGGSPTMWPKLVLGVSTPNGSVVDQKMIDKHNSLRLNKDAIKKSMAYHSDYHMKVVVNPVEMPETWDEIRAFMDELEVPKDKIWIMPPGDNREELIRVYPMVIDWCTQNYYNFTGREHIIAFDTKREV